MTSRLHAHIGTFRQLEILLSVYKQGSIKAASEVLFLTQPTVSMQLKKLSEAVGMPLYQQIGKKIHFTDAGITMVESAREILNLCEELDMKLSKLRGANTGTLRIACVTTAKYFIPHLLGPFCKQFPGIEIKFTVANRQQIIERFESEKDDFYVFSHLPDTLDLNLIRFMPNDLVPIVSIDHPLAQQETVSLEEFCEQDFLIREQGSGTRHAIEQYFQSLNKTLKIKMTVESNEAIIHSVMAGLGVSILSAHTLSFGEIYGVKRLDIPEFNIQNHWSFVWSKSKRPSPVADVFLNYVQSEGRQVMLSTLTEQALQVSRSKQG